MALVLGSVWLLLAFVVAYNPVSAAACSNQEFTCTQGLCVALDCVCDFTNDCEDGSDEKNCSTYTRCDFEEGFCELIQISETPSKWIRTTEVAELKHDHKSKIAHFLSLSPVGGNRTRADLSSPVFLPSHTCQLSFYYYVGGTHGDLQVLVQTHPADQSTEVWKQSTQLQTETWLRTVIQFSSNHSFQVVIRGELSADSEAFEVLAVDDLSFSPGCMILSGTINNNSLHRRDEFRP